jgi:hypothetical protein
MQLPFRDRKNLSWAVCDRLAIQRDVKRAGEDEATDREKMSVPTLAGSWV